MSEVSFKSRVLKYLKKFKGIWFYKASDQWQSGIPDIIICMDGRFIAIELKVGINKPSKLQLHVGQMIKEAGGEWHCCYNMDQIKQVLNLR